MKLEELPVVSIGKDEYYVSVACSELYHKEEPTRVLSFGDMEDKQTHYEFIYDSELQVVRHPQNDPSKEILTLPQMVQIDPKGMAEKYGLSQNQLPVCDHLLYCPKELISNRIDKGMLPEIEIAGEKFFIDIRMGELRHKHQYFKNIRLDEMETYSDQDRHIALYDPKGKGIIHITEHTTYVPERAIVLSLPNVLVLDPVGAARKFGMQDNTFLKEYPLQYGLKALEIPREKTGLKKMLEKNRSRNIATVQDRKKGRSKGKGI